MYTELGLFIDGKWANGKGRKSEPVINPANEKPLADLPHASKADLDEAVEAAKKGFALWRKTTAWDRGRVMRKAADLMRERAPVIGKILTQEQGKTLILMRLRISPRDLAPEGSETQPKLGMSQLRLVL